MRTSTGEGALSAAVFSLLPSITAGFVNGILIVIFQSAYAALIFTGPLIPFASGGMGALLFGAFIMGVIIALTSAFKSTVTAPQDAPAAILAFIVANIVGANTALAGQSLFATAITTLAVTALFTGVCMLLLGFFNLGNLVRFIPYPVVGGFLAGTGWILVKGALGIIIDEKLTVSNYDILARLPLFLKWLPGMIFAVLLLFVMRRYRYFFTMPLMIAGAIISFYLVLWLSGTTIESATTQGWLMNQFKGGADYTPLFSLSLADVDWGTIRANAGDLGSITIISIISLLLNASGLELIARQEIDLSRELRAAGIANVASGISGSSVGYMSLSLTALAHRIGSTHRISGIVSAGICGATLYFGWQLPSYFPRPLLGGLLIYLGLTFLLEWLYYAWFKLPKMEYALVLIILFTIGFAGFLPGIAVGTVAAVVLFVINYSRINVVKHALTGENYQSNVDRSLPVIQQLIARGRELYILQLQGFLFFGQANTIYAMLRDRALDKGQPRLRFALLDFRLVSGLDSSALNSFEKLNMLAQSQNFVLVLTHLSKGLQRQFSTTSLNTETPHLRFFKDMDHGQEWVEEQLLTDSVILEMPAAAEVDIHRFLEKLLEDVLQKSLPRERLPEIVRELSKYTVQQKIEEGHYLIHQQMPPMGLYILVSGWVTAQLEQQNGKTIRLRKMGSGTVIGELSAYLSRPASAAVITNSACHLLFLSYDSLLEMEQKAPELAAVFHRFIIRILGERLINNNKTLQALRQ